MISPYARAAEGVAEPDPAVWVWLAVLAVVTVAVIAVTIAWTRRSRQQGTLHPPTAEEENDPVDPAATRLRLSATTVLAVLSGVLVLALVVFVLGRVADLVA